MELLVVIAVIGILVAIITPIVGGIQEKARRTADAANARQIALAYANYAQSGERARTINAANIYEWTAVLAKEVAFNDAGIYTLDSDELVAAAGDLPRIVASPVANDPTAAWTVHPQFDGFPLSFAVANQLSPRAPTTTPIVWTRGLRAGQTTWDATTGVYGSDGGHVARLDGSVEFMQDTSAGGGVFVNPTSQQQTTNIRDALLGANVNILESTGN